MKAIVQRVKSAQVDIEGKTVGKIGNGFLILLGVRQGDDERHAKVLADKISTLRIFTDENDKMNLSLKDIGGSALIISNFTLYADCRKGNRPSFTGAGEPGESQRLYELFVERARRDCGHVATGEFGADMQVSLVNDGPFTICLDTDDLKRPRR